MNALAELKKRALPAANPANAANHARVYAVDSHDSQDSQGAGAASEKRHRVAPLRPDTDAARTHLLALAEAAWLPAALVHRLRDLDVAACAGLGDPQLRTFLHQVHDTAMRHAGERPADDTAAILCAQCGPVWAHPSIAAALPLVGGWPRALGCPWCFVRKAGGYIPRPPVSCGGCLHFVPGAMNPTAGMGACKGGHGSHFASECHRCEGYALTVEKGDLA